MVCAPGKAPRTLQPLLRVSGKPLFAFVSSSPLYKDLSTSLSSGSQVANIKALQAALKRAGFYRGRIDGDFDTATEAALEEWQDARGLSVTGTLDITRCVWIPEGGVLSSWKVAVGDKVNSATQLARVIFERPLWAQALVGQDYVTSLEVGQSAALAIDGHDSRKLKGKVVAIAKTPASSASGGDSSGTPSYTVTLKVKGLPAYARPGMTGTLSILLARKSGVLVVPTGAVIGSGSSTLVRVLQNGAPVLRTVTSGLATSSLTEITSGLAEGEKVVTAVVDNASTSTTASRAFGGAFARPGGGTGVRSSGAPFGGGAVPGGQ
jgi:peptidoglycan hydrolase-like protein with peptidoglycan-binding domain